MEPLPLVAVLLVLQADPAGTAGGKPPAPDCSAWSVDGLRVGLARDEIEEALPSARLFPDRARPGERGESASLLWLDAPARPGARLTLDDGRIQVVSVLHLPADADEEAARSEAERQRAALVARLGDPDSDVETGSGHAPGDPGPEGATPARRTLRTRTWTSAACDVVLTLETGWQAGTRGGERRVVTTTLAATAWAPGPGVAPVPAERR
jgi:hypothetical protein